jgi:hypothetical protein
MMSHSAGPPPPGQDSISKQPVPTAYTQPQHYSIGTGPYPTHPPTHPAPSTYPGPPNHIYGYGGQHRAGAWGYGANPPGFDHQQRFSYPPNQPMPINSPVTPQQQQPAPIPNGVPSIKNTMQRPQGLARTEEEESANVISSDSQVDRAFQQRKNVNQTGKVEEEDKGSPNQSQSLSGNQKIHNDDLESVRVKPSATNELTLAEVKPIQSDFHFFVHNNKGKFLTAAENEVNSIVMKQKLSIDKNSPKYKYLINSNLNCRLLRAWENLSMNERTEYMKREEEDRRRFMDEDEVASRHCFTLTARVRSPSKNKPSSSLSGDQDDGDRSEGDESVERDIDEKYDNDELESRSDGVKAMVEENGVLSSRSLTVSSQSDQLPSQSDIVPTVSPNSNRTSAGKDTNSEITSSFTTENVVTPPNKRDDNEKIVSENAPVSTMNDAPASDDLTPTKAALDDSYEKKVIKRPQNGSSSQRDDTPPKRNRFNEDDS